MRILHLAIASLSLLSSALPSVAAASSEPACLPADVVPVSDEDTSREWLSRSAPDEIRAYVVKVVRAARWEGDTLSYTCSMEGQPYRESGLTVSGAGAGIEATRQVLFSRLAAASGHTSEEGEELKRKFAVVVTSFFRRVRDEKGRELGEDQLILRRHEQKLGIVRPTEADLGVDAKTKQDQKARGAELKEKIKAAKARGDMAEVMRLAGEAQSMSAPMAEKAQKVQERTDRQTWDLLQSAYPDLARAAFKTRIAFGQISCLPCRPPEPPRR
jgi:hypothetical protein